VVYLHYVIYNIIHKRYKLVPHFDFAAIKLLLLFYN
jgi:hypothetical protein